ncbi:phosphoribosyltransferase [Alsobacter sp. SYSU M60028]|uniref:Phosphoribosyltransferase n=1 Tax=Alsobacter ponti TaxID=2962936 RepID=A0ABT1LE04_9HYPH|nr:phosphoribosyltransferase family protein [Alsobacter ponti]MCP8939328.1 phosphoribosyltransferase [Alsobacter ponti]
MAAPDIFADRADAGRRLAQELAKRSFVDPVVYALPRGGVPVAAPVAEALRAPLDILLVRKIGVPSQPELAAGAVVDGADPIAVWNDDVTSACGLGPEELDALKREQLALIEKRRALYGASRAPVDPAGRTAIVVDDGLATGATARAAIAALRRRGARAVVLAVPVAPAEAVPQFRALCDEVVCLSQPSWFPGVGAFYSDFGQTTDAQVVAALKAARTHFQ